MEPWGDNLKVRVSNADEYGFGADAKGVETGIVVKIPTSDDIVAYGMHNFSYESSWMNDEKLDKLLKRIKKLVNKRIWWEAYQDRGRRIRVEEDGKNVDYVFLKISDIICYSKDISTEAKFVEDERAGSFKV